MSALLFALALFAADAPAAAAPADPDPAQEAGWPVGAPRDDYGLVSWCYGALGGYLELHDQVMPEVTRIETTYRRPGSRLADDLKVYADMQKDGRANLKLFARAIEAAERASLKPINAIGADGVRRGRGTWAAAPQLSKARLAQEWMSWALPARCEPAAVALEKRARLLGATFEANARPAPAEAPAPAADAAGRLTEAPAEAPAPPEAAPASAAAPPVEPAQQ